MGTNLKENVGLWSKVVAHNDLRLLSQSGHVNRYANEFQHLCSRIPKFFLISTSYKVKRFLAKLKENVRNKVLMDPKESVVLGGTSSVSFTMQSPLTLHMLKLQKGERTPSLDPMRRNQMDLLVMCVERKLVGHTPTAPTFTRRKLQRSSL